MNSWIKAVLALVALFVAAVPVGAQPGGSRGVATRVPVTVALVDELSPAHTPFALLRRNLAEGGDVIVVPTTADADLLSDAVRALLTVRRHQGDQVADGGTLRVTARTRGRPALPWAVRVLADIRRTTPQTVPGVGSARSVVIWLPPQRPR